MRRIDSSEEGDYKIPLAAKKRKRKSEDVACSSLLNATDLPAASCQKMSGVRARLLKEGFPLPTLWITLAVKRKHSHTYESTSTSLKKTRSHDGGLFRPLDTTGHLRGNQHRSSQPVSSCEGKVMRGINIERGRDKEARSTLITEWVEMSACFWLGVFHLWKRSFVLLLRTKILNQTSPHKPSQVPPSLFGFTVLSCLTKYGHPILYVLRSF